LNISLHKEKNNGTVNIQNEKDLKGGEKKREQTIFKIMRLKSNITFYGMQK